MFFCIFEYYFWVDIFDLIRFNETEGVAAITSIISRYKIEIQDEPQFKHETFEERKSRILDVQKLLTIAYVLLDCSAPQIERDCVSHRPRRLPLSFKRR